MKRLADQFVELMQDLGWELDYSKSERSDARKHDHRSVRRLEAVGRPIASLVGAYLGEVMIRQIGGSWGWMPEFDVAAAQLPAGGWTSRR
jgi:hypothetical protein